VSRFGDLIPLLLLVAFGGAYVLWRRLTRLNPKAKAKLNACDYIIFEAHPDQLPDIEADLAPHGWQLIQKEPSEAPANLCRFEKIDGRSAPLSKIFEFEQSMSRTANRKVLPEFPIKIKDQGTGRKALV
jgi:hypothetical protein